MSMDGLYGVPAPVESPKQSPPLHSLMATATQVDEPKLARDVLGQTIETEPWTVGFEFLPEACEQGGVWGPCLTTVDDEPQLKTQFDQQAPELFIPYQIVGQFTCSTKGFEVARYAEKAEINLELTTPKAMELEFWSGRLMAQHPTGVNNMSLVNQVTDDGILNPGWDPNDPTTVTAVSPRVALALIAQGLANCGVGSRGMIHATPYLAELWGTAWMIEHEGPRLVTRTRGTYVVSGGGYPGTGPYVTSADGDEETTPPANQVWVYATGLVNWRLSDVTVIPPDPDDLAGAMKPSQGAGIAHGWDNEVVFIAERFAAAVWDPCCALAVLVDLEEGVC